MYKRILIPLENSPSDRTILAHVCDLARLMESSFCLLHVADGWVAQHYDYFGLRESEEMRNDKIYLEQVSEELTAQGFSVETVLALGDPVAQIVSVAQEKNVDLIAMSTHGHRFLSDIIYGSTADKVRHRVDIPVLLLKAKGQKE